MIIVDSCGWLEWFTDGKLADQYKKNILWSQTKSWYLRSFFTKSIRFSRERLAKKRRCSQPGI